jgi:hypothetical protein
MVMKKGIFDDVLGEKGAKGRYFGGLKRVKNILMGKGNTDMW